MLTAINHWLLVKMHKPADRIGKIWLSDQSKQKNLVRTGTVVSVGTGRWNNRSGHDEPVAKVGDNILYVHHHSIPVENKYGDDLYFVGAAHVEAIIESEGSPSVESFLPE